MVTKSEEGIFKISKTRCLKELNRFWSTNARTKNPSHVESNIEIRMT